MPRSRRKRGIESRGVQVRDCGLRAREVWQAPDRHRAGGRLRCSQRKPIIRSALLLLSLACSRRRPRSDGKQRERGRARERRDTHRAAQGGERERRRPSAGPSPSMSRSVHQPPTHPRLARSLTCCRGGRDAAQRSEKTLTPKMRIAAACLSASLPRCHSEAASTAADSQKLLRRRGGHTRINGQGFPLSHQSLG